MYVGNSILDTDAFSFCQGFHNQHIFTNSSVNLNAYMSLVS